MFEELKESALQELLLGKGVVETFGSQKGLIQVRSDFGTLEELE